MGYSKVSRYAADDAEDVGWLKAVISTAFKALRKQGFIARQDFSCCTSCGCAEIATDAKESKKPVLGYTFYNSQNAEILKSTREGDYLRRNAHNAGRSVSVYLAFGSTLPDATEAMPRAVGNIIKTELEKCPGAVVDWDGTAEQKIGVSVDREKMRKARDAARQLAPEILHLHGGATATVR